MITLMYAWLRQIEHWGLIIFFATFSFQTRLVVARWAPMSFGPFLVGDVRPFSEWMSGFIYASDLLLLALLLFWLIRRRLLWWRREDWLLLGLFGLACVSIVNSVNVPVALFRTGKLLEYILLFWYVRDVIKDISWRTMGIAITTGALLQAVIAIVQSLWSRSIGLHILGESPLSLSMPGVAVFIADGTKYLRAYGATPHPNILAVFLYVVSLVLVIIMFYDLYPRIAIRRFIWMTYPIVLWALFLTYARTILGVWCMVMAVMGIWVWYMRTQFSLAQRSRAWRIWIATFVIGISFLASHWIQVQSRIHIDFQEEAVTERLFYNKVAGKATESKPVLGLGMGQFVPHLVVQYPNYPVSIYQPVHNVYLLISSELGVAGVLLFSIFIVELIARFVRQARNGWSLGHSMLLCAVIGILLMGLLDHFLWTLQQGSFVMWIIFAIMASLA